MITLSRLFCLLVPIFLIGCKKEPVTIEDMLPMTEYYNSEIFTRENTAIYGKWRLADIREMYNLKSKIDYKSIDYIEFVPYGIYAIINEDEIVDFGKITLIDQDSLAVSLWLESHDSLIEDWFVAFNITLGDKPSLIKSDSSDLIWTFYLE